MISLDQIYEKDPSMVSREIAGEAILVPIRQNVGDLESIYTLNETAARAWELIDGQKTLSDIRDVIVEEFEVDKRQAQEDLIELMSDLVSISAVEKK